MYSRVTQRPRNIDTIHASALLYGDLGTSKAYVIGLAFALVGYASFWLLLPVAILTIFIGINYTVICKHFPNGGGVYSSARHRSEILALMGAFFIIADYLITAALSALSAFHYLNVQDPILFSSISILIIGILNYFGPRHSGMVAFVVSIAAVLCLTILVFFSIPHLQTAWHNLQPLTGKPWTIWNHFVGIIVALSGIEAIANITGIMKLNPGSTMEKPLVTKTSTKAIAIVITEVAIYTTFFAFVASAINNFQIGGGEVDAPGNPNVRDYMLRYLAEVFVGDALGKKVGLAFAWVLSLAIGILLLSAVNTAINGLIALQYRMAGDGEFPKKFEKINRFGVPLIPLLIATIIPILLIVSIKNIATLATLYAVGFVGAIATNLGVTSTDFSLQLKWKERILMGIAFVIMTCIEITLFIEKPHARYYALGVILVGLALRVFSQQRKKVKAFIPSLPTPEVKPPFPSLLCPMQHKGKALDVALERSITTNSPLHILFIRVQSVLSEKDLLRNWESDPEAKEIKLYALAKGNKDLIYFHYSVSDSAIQIIAAYAILFESQELLVDAPKKSRRLIQALQGNTFKKLKTLLPQDVNLTVID